MILPRIFSDAEVTCTFTCGSGAPELLHHLAVAAEQYLSRRTRLSPVEFTANLACAKRLCSLGALEAEPADGTLVKALHSCLSAMALYDDVWLAPLAIAASTNSANAVRVIESWLPRDVRELVPADGAITPEAARDVLAGLNALEGRRFVGVVDEHTLGSEARLPKPEDFTAIHLGSKMEDLGTLRDSGMTVFRF